MTITINCRAEQTQGLITLHQQLWRGFEQSRSLDDLALQSLKALMLDVLFASPGFDRFFAESQVRADTLYLVFNDSELRNMPWQLAIEDRPLLSLAKANRLDLTPPPIGGPPLTILVMVSAPEGASTLNYEYEETRILRALGPLLASGQVQVHFTEDGTLSTLEAKLLENRYDILHFLGHGTYRNKKNYLVFEDNNGLPVKISASTFNESIQRARRIGHCPTLMVLSACHSAQGPKDEDLHGVADRLLAGGVPAVVAMSDRITDECAIEFAGSFYEALAQNAPLADAFQFALSVVRRWEQRCEKFDTGQWLIPQLLLSRQVTNLLDINIPRTPLKFSDFRYITGDQILLPLRGTDRKKYHYVFIGRREEMRRATSGLNDPGQQVILLRGQGGVGKTALAEHIAIRMLAKNQRFKLFAHNDLAPAFEKLLEQMTHFLTATHQEFSTLLDLNKLIKPVEKFIYLLDRITQKCEPVFIFDNIEAFQTRKDDDWVWDMENHADLLEALTILAKHGGIPIIITGRYPVKELLGVFICDINSASYNDFLKKCWQLPFGPLLYKMLKRNPIAPAVGDERGEIRQFYSFEELIRIFYTGIGGNYRVLEFFNELFSENSVGIIDTIRKLQTIDRDVRASPGNEQRIVLERMGQNLIISELIDMLLPEEKEALSLLANFELPVLPMALGMQRDKHDFSADLDRLADLTLIERVQGKENRIWYLVTPLVKDLLERIAFPVVAFDMRMAGDYHKYVVENAITDDVTNFYQAFDWYFKSGSTNDLQALGIRLCNAFYELRLFRLASYYGLKIAELLKKDTDWTIINIVAISLQYLGLREFALNFLLKHYKIIDHQQGERGWRITLHSLCKINIELGNFTEALEYARKGLSWAIQSGHEDAELQFIFCIAFAHKREGELSLAIEEFSHCLTLCAKLNDLILEFQIRHAMADIYLEIGNLSEAQQFLTKSYMICEQLNNYKNQIDLIAQLISLGSRTENREFTQNYFEKGLRLAQSMNNLEDEGKMLNSIGIALMKWKEYGDSLEYLLNSYEILKEVGNGQDKATVLGNISMVYQLQGNDNKALEFLFEALKSAQVAADRGNENFLYIKIAKNYERRGAFDHASVYYEQSLKLCRAFLGKNKESETLEHIIDLYERKGEAEQVLAFRIENLNVVRALGQKEIEKQLLRRIGSTYYDAQQYEDASKYYVQFLTIEIGDPNRKADLFIRDRLALCAFHRENFASARDYYHDNLLAAREMGSREYEGKSLYGLGSLAFRQSDYQSTLDYMIENLRIQQELNDEVGEVKSLDLLAGALFRTGRFTEALEFGRQYLDKILAFQGAKPEQIVIPLNFLAKTVLELKDYEQAIYYFEQIRALHEKSGNEALELKALRNLATLAEQLQKLESGIDYYEKILQIQRRNNDEANEVKTLKNLILIYLQIEKPEQALPYATQLLEKTQRSSDLTEIASARFALCRFYYDLEDYDASLKYALQSLSEFNASGQIKEQIIAVLHIGEIYYKTGSNRDALEQYAQALALQEQLDDQAGAADTLVRMTDAYFLLEEFDAAQDCCEKSLLIWRRIGNSDKEQEAVQRMGHISYKKYLYPKALHLFNEGLAYYQEKGNKHRTAELMYCVGYTQYELGQIKEAIGQLRASEALFIELGMQGQNYSTEFLESVKNELNGYNFLK